VRSKSDPCVYFRGNKTRKQIIVMYIDDLLIATKTQEDLLRVIRNIQEHYKTSKDTLHHYLGMHIEVDQSLYEVAISNEQHI
jgi:hypothetical protein